MHVERHVFHSDLGKEGGGRLLAWCREHGADSFSLSVIGSPPELETAAVAIEARLGHLSLAPAQIPTKPEGQPGSYWMRATDRWSLNEHSLPLLLECFPQGLLTCYPSGDAWCEDPCLFRGAELMLGVISHEGEGVLRIEAREQLALDQSDITYRLKGKRIGYYLQAL